MTTGYLLLDPRTRGIRYVGITSRNLDRRVKEHLIEARRGKYDTYRSRWINTLLQLGLTPEVVSRDLFPDRDSAVQWEVDTIARFRADGVNLTNTTNGGDGTLGYVPSDECRRKKHLAMVGKKRPAISAAKLGVPRSQEVREILSKANKGKPWSAARRLAHSTRKSGK